MSTIPWRAGPVGKLEQVIRVWQGLWVIGVAELPRIMNAHLSPMRLFDFSSLRSGAAR